MGRHEIISPDSLRNLSGHVARMQQEIHNLRRRLSAYVCELDDASQGIKPLFRFTLDAALATSDATGSGLITNQYGEGTAQSTASAVTLINLAITGGYLFSGSSGQAGLAYYGSSTGSPIIQMECPAT